MKMLEIPVNQAHLMDWLICIAALLDPPSILLQSLGFCS
jgi:hypothetical protein